MITFHKAFDEVQEDDLKLLIESGATEGLQLEFKETITNNISLMEEVVAFANTQGGDIL
ncbi:AlbA family DNA-binding domain-containing protein [Paenibacillus chitinolyticus]|uniref:AlbA family DNA-binding domain-containing protein n=1 Tax=Paenibacillus chitinolyticus TaxID=79263 RepID=UPI003CFF5D24